VYPGPLSLKENNFSLVCGTQSRVNDTRIAIRSPRPMDVLRGGPTISFHVENFGARARDKLCAIFFLAM
jgi:hypothetical protein